MLPRLRTALAPTLTLALAFALAAPSGANDHLLVSGYLSDSVTRHDAANGALLGSLGSGGLNGVLGMAVGPDGALYVCSELSNSVKRFDADTGAFLGDFIFDDPLTVQDETGGLNHPAGIVFGPDDRAIVCSFASNSLIEYDGRTGAFSRVLVTSGGGGLNGPDAGLTLGPDGNLYVPSYFTDRVKKYSPVSGAFLGNFIGPATGLSRPRTIVFPGDGFVYVTSEGSDRVIQCDATTGAFVRALVIDDPLTPGDETGGLDGPTGLVFGTDGRICVASINTNAVLRYDAASGAFVDAFVPPMTGGLLGPTFLALRPDVANYGPLTPNSFGRGASLVARGSSSVAAQHLELELHAAPPNRVVIFFYNAAPDLKPFGDGNLLVQRFDARKLKITTADAFGRATHALDFAAAAGSALPFTPGVSRYFQAYVRDAGGPLGTGFNLSDAVEVRFAP